MVKANRGEYGVLWPRGKKAKRSVRLAERVHTLENKIVCELWDGVFFGDKIFAVIEEELGRRYRGIKFVNYEVFGLTHGGEAPRVLAALPEKLKQNRCDAVISGVGC